MNPEAFYGQNVFRTPPSTNRTHGKYKRPRRDLNPHAGFTRLLPAFQTGALLLLGLRERKRRLEDLNLLILLRWPPLSRRAHCHSAKTANSAWGRNRTGNLLSFNQALYHLSCPKHFDPVRGH